MIDTILNKNIQKTNNKAIIHNLSLSHIHQICKADMIDYFFLNKLEDATGNWYNCGFGLINIDYKGIK